MAERLIDAAPVENQLQYEACIQAGTPAGPGYGRALRLVKEAPTVERSVIIKCNMMLQEKDYAALADKLAKQLDDGALALPAYCELLAEVPKGGKLQIVAEVQHETD